MPNYVHNLRTANRATAVKISKTNLRGKNHAKV